MSKLMRLLAAAAVTSLVMGACAQTTTETDDDGEAPAAPRTVTVQMAALNDSGQSGTATLTEENGQTRVVVELDNSPEGPQPIHIHDGTCEELGAVVHDLGTLMNGRVETVVDVSLDELLAGTFAVNGHKSPEEIAVYISCGDIVEG